MKKILLDKEELELEKEIEKDEWKSVPNLENEIRKYQKYARYTLNKNKKINIRISEYDYEKIKIKAAQEGLPYQTLISSIIHKYLTGQLLGDSVTQNSSMHY
ncbi:antitoxin [Candidatus Poribacteria bacterium]|nr:antitoxin [Candidatus Poribacteria bacterium]